MTATLDTPGFEAARAAMVVSQLRTSGVSDARVVAAMADVPREAFLPESLGALAYRDRTVPLGEGRGQNPPLATGLLLNEARIAPGERVLVVGAAGGYAAAVAARLAGQVVAVESDAALAGIARTALNGQAKLVEGPLTDGAPGEAAFDVLIMDGAVGQLPDALVQQLRVGGRIVTGLVDRGVTRLASGVRTDDSFGLRAFADVECVVLPGFEKPDGFKF